MLLARTFFPLAIGILFNLNRFVQFKFDRTFFSTFSFANSFLCLQPFPGTIFITCEYLEITISALTHRRHVKAACPSAMMLNAHLAMLIFSSRHHTPSIYINNIRHKTIFQGLFLWSVVISI